MGFRDAYNRFLDNNSPLNDLDRVRRAVREARRGHVPALLGALVAGALCSLALSFLASILGYGNVMMSLVWSLVTAVVNMLASNIVFSVFLIRVREGRLTGEVVQRYLQTIVTQVLCMAVLAMGQTLASSMVGQILAFSAHASTFGSVAVSMIFTLASASVAYHIYDGERRVGTILRESFITMGRNWAPLLGLSILFMAWTVFINVAYVNLLYGQITQVQTINNVFHALLSVGDFALLGQVALFYAINYIVGGLLEIAPLLGLAVCYDEDRAA